MAIDPRPVDVRAVLANTDFFADAPRDTLDGIAAHAETRQLVRGDVLFQEGDAPDALYVVLAGRLAIALGNPIDRRESVVALMEAGDLFGELGLLDDRPRSAMARALESSLVLAVPYGPVVEMFRQQPTMLWNVTRLLAQRLRAMDEALADSVFLDVTGRTAKRILELAGDGDQFVLPVTQEELAGMVGASRERVNKAISSFIKLGWLEQRDRNYRITQRDRLELRAR
jgi:CRP/FNR family transcriptional regulator, cyclic AMP receptor protein